MHGIRLEGERQVEEAADARPDGLGVVGVDGVAGQDVGALDLRGGEKRVQVGGQLGAVLRPGCGFAPAFARELRC